MYGLKKKTLYILNNKEVQGVLLLKEETIKYFPEKFLPI